MYSKTSHNIPHKIIANLLFRTAAIPCLLALSVACSSLLPPHLTRAQLKQMEGVWKSDGYGYLLKAKRGQLWIYDINQQSCIEDDLSTHEFSYGFPSLKWQSSDAFLIGQEPSGKHIEFNRISAVPSVCKQAPDKSPLATFDVFTANMSEHYAFFELHNIDWKQRVRLARRKINNSSSDQQLFETMKNLLAGISDSHLGFRARVGNKTRTYTRRTLRDLEPALQPHYKKLTQQQQSRQTFSKFRQHWVARQRKLVAVQLLGKHARSSADGKLRWGRDGNRGYFSISRFAGYSPTDSVAAETAAVERHLDKILEQLSGIQHLTLDVSLARGGYSSVAKSIASRLAGLHNTDATYHYLTRYAADSENQNQQKVFMRASNRRKHNRNNPMSEKPPAITLVTSDVTTSAAEEFVLAMRVLPNVTHLGTPTNGSLSDILDKSLPNGWLMILSNEVLIDPGGKSYEGTGIPPEQTVNLFDSDDPSATHAEAIEKIFRH